MLKQCLKSIRCALNSVNLAHGKDSKFMIKPWGKLPSITLCRQGAQFERFRRLSWSKLQYGLSGMQISRSVNAEMSWPPRSLSTWSHGKSITLRLLIRGKNGRMEITISHVERLLGGQDISALTDLEICIPDNPYCSLDHERRLNLSNCAPCLHKVILGNFPHGLIMNLLFLPWAKLTEFSAHGWISGIVLTFFVYVVISRTCLSPPYQPGMIHTIGTSVPVYYYQI